MLKLGLLSNGDIVIGKEELPTVVGKEYSDDDCYLINCLKIHSIPVDGQGLQVLLAPIFMPVCQDLVKISKSKLITTHDVPEQLKNEYIKTTSGIISPNSQEGSTILNMASRQPVMK